MSTAWGCSHQYENSCDLLKKPCEPGMKGCTLYGKALFSSAENPSNEAYARRQSVKEKESLQEAMENAKFF